MFRKTMFAGIALLLLSLNVSAQEAPNAYFTFQVVGPKGAPAAGNCLIVGDRGYATAPSRHHWGQSGGKPQHCGFARAEDFNANRQAILGVACVYDSNKCFVENRAVRNGVSIIKCMVANPYTNVVTFREGTCTYTVGGKRYVKEEALWFMDITAMTTTFRPIMDGSKCLIFNNRGHDTKPTLYRWNDVRNDTQYCGLGSKQALQQTGQALFVWNDL